MHDSISVSERNFTLAVSLNTYGFMRRLALQCVNLGFSHTGTCLRRLEVRTPPGTSGNGDRPRHHARTRSSYNSRILLEVIGAKAPPHAYELWRHSLAHDIVYAITSLCANADSNQVTIEP